VIIQQAVWLYARFALSFRDVEDLLAERGVLVSYETVRRWVKYFGLRSQRIFDVADPSLILPGWDCHVVGLVGGDMRP
jgi:transposase-like protein